eukprot:gene1892-3667_t
MIPLQRAPSSAYFVTSDSYDFYSECLNSVDFFYEVIDDVDQILLLAHHLSSIVENSSLFGKWIKALSFMRNPYEGRDSLVEMGCAFHDVSCCSTFDISTVIKIRGKNGKRAQFKGEDARKLQLADVVASRLFITLIRWSSDNRDVILHYLHDMLESSDLYQCVLAALVLADKLIAKDGDVKQFDWIRILKVLHSCISIYDSVSQKFCQMTKEFEVSKKIALKAEARFNMKLKTVSQADTDRNLDFPIQYYTKSNEELRLLLERKQAVEKTNAVITFELGELREELKLRFASVRCLLMIITRLLNERFDFISSLSYKEDLLTGLVELPWDVLRRTALQEEILSSKHIDSMPPPSTTTASSSDPTSVTTTDIDDDRTGGGETFISFSAVRAFSTAACRVYDRLQSLAIPMAVDAFEWLVFSSSTNKQSILGASALCYWALRNNADGLRLFLSLPLMSSSSSTHNLPWLASGKCLNDPVNLDDNEDNNPRHHDKEEDVLSLSIPSPSPTRMAWTALFHKFSSTKHALVCDLADVDTDSGDENPFLSRTNRSDDDVMAAHALMYSHPDAAVVPPSQFLTDDFNLSCVRKITSSAIICTGYVNSVVDYLGTYFRPSYNNSCPDRYSTSIDSKRSVQPLHVIRLLLESDPSSHGVHVVHRTCGGNDKSNNDTTNNNNMCSSFISTVMQLISTPSSTKQRYASTASACLAILRCLLEGSAPPRLYPSLAPDNHHLDCRPQLSSCKLFYESLKDVLLPIISEVSKWIMMIYMEDRAYLLTSVGPEGHPLLGEGLKLLAAVASLDLQTVRDALSGTLILTFGVSTPHNMTSVQSPSLWRRSLSDESCKDTSKWLTPLFDLFECVMECIPPTHRGSESTEVQSDWSYVLESSVELFSAICVDSATSITVLEQELDIADSRDLSNFFEWCLGSHTNGLGSLQQHVYRVLYSLLCCEKSSSSSSSASPPAVSGLSRSNPLSPLLSTAFRVKLCQGGSRLFQICELLSSSCRTLSQQMENKQGIAEADGS